MKLAERIDPSRMEVFVRMLGHLIDDPRMTDDDLRRIVQINLQNFQPGEAWALKGDVDLFGDGVRRPTLDRVAPPQR